MIVKVIFVIACVGIVTADELDVSFQARLKKLRTNIGRLVQENKELKSKLKSLEEKYGIHLKDKENSIKLDALALEVYPSPSHPPDHPYFYKENNCLGLPLLLWKTKLFLKDVFSRKERICSQSSKLELQWLEHLWDYENLFETEVVRANEDCLWSEVKKHNMVDYLQNKRREANLTGIGFTAGVSQTLTNIGTQQRIVFDRFVSGNPESYDTATGIFTVPVSGWYVFQVSMLVDSGFEADLHIIRAHNPTLIEDISGLYADARFSASHASSSRTIVLYLVKGGEIFVRNGFKTTIELHGNQFTTFSGWLLYELST